MKYIWMIILGIIWIWWTVEVVKDLIYCYKHFGHPFECIDDSTIGWFVFHGLLAFALSLALWLMDKVPIGG